jgi:coniferyl-aldehyde dehydrogenase
VLFFEEIFGPVMPICTYDTIDEAIAYVNAHERPLALYYLGPKGPGREAVLSRTTSGGVAVNDVMTHYLHENLPFGGVGPSGMGAYHGKDGFLNFSHKKSVYLQTRVDAFKMLRPPYGDSFRKATRKLLAP